MTTGEHNLAALADAALERHGDRDSLYFEGTWHSSADLHDRSLRVSSGLRQLGVEPGDRVSVAARTSGRGARHMKINSQPRRLRHKINKFSRVQGRVGGRCGSSIGS